MIKKIIAVIMALALMLSMAGCGSSSNTSNTTSTESVTFEWPSDDKLAQMIPEPEGTITSLDINDESGNANLEVEISISDTNYCREYFEAAKEMGFDTVLEESLSGMDYSLDRELIAENDDGWRLSVSNDYKEMEIRLESKEHIAADETDIAGYKSKVKAKTVEIEKKITENGEFVATGQEAVDMLEKVIGSNSGKIDLAEVGKGPGFLKLNGNSLPCINISIDGTWIESSSDVANNYIITMEKEDKIGIQLCSALYCLTSEDKISYKEAYQTIKEIIDKVDSAGEDQDWTENECIQFSFSEDDDRYNFSVWYWNPN